MNAKEWWSVLTSNATHLQVIFGVIISVSTAITGWKTIQLNERTAENNAQLARIERQLSEEKFGFERIRDIYDRTEKYLMSAQQDERRGRALVVLVNSLPTSELRSTLLGVIAVEARSNSVAAKAADAVVKPEPPKVDSSSFIGKIVVRLLDDGYSVELLEPFGFKDSRGVVWTVPKGAVISGASIPRTYWSVIGSPLSGQYRAASILHEYYTEAKSRPRDDVNNMFYEALQKSGVSSVQAKTIFAAVNSFGPRWSSGEAPTK
jgi:hypothetical protein